MKEIITYYEGGTIPIEVSYIIKYTERFLFKALRIVKHICLNE